jgi:hypothetical protein
MDDPSTILFQRPMTTAAALGDHHQKPEAILYLEPDSGLVILRQTFAR